MKIRNCQIKFKCTMTWDSLIETSEASIKYCIQCDRGVHYCNNESELEHALQKDWCVAMQITDEYDDSVTHELLGDIINMPDYEKS